MFNQENLFFISILTCGLFNVFLWSLYVYNVALIFNKNKNNNQQINKKKDDILIENDSTSEVISDLTPETNINPNTVYILRGFPGAGKNILYSLMNIIVVKYILYVTLKIFFITMVNLIMIMV